MKASYLKPPCIFLNFIYFYFKLQNYKDVYLGIVEVNGLFSFKLVFIYIL